MQYPPEYQLIDDFGWGKLNNSELEDWQKAGADYAMYPADEKIKKLKPAGEWNSTKIKYYRKLRPVLLQPNNVWFVLEKVKVRSSKPLVTKLIVEVKVVLNLNKKSKLDHQNPLS